MKTKPEWCMSHGNGPHIVTPYGLVCLECSPAPGEPDDLSVAAAYRFFHENSGCIVGHSAVGAMALARAERGARERGWSFDWGLDDAADVSEDGETGEPPWGCVLRDEHGRVLGSLWGIDGSSKDYARVVQAELALEADAAERHPCSNNRSFFEKTHARMFPSIGENWCAP